MSREDFENDIQPPASKSSQRSLPMHKCRFHLLLTIGNLLGRIKKTKQKKPIMVCVFPSIILEFGNSSFISNLRLTWDQRHSTVSVVPNMMLIGASFYWNRARFTCSKGQNPAHLIRPAFDFSSKRKVSTLLRHPHASNRFWSFWPFMIYFSRQLSFFLYWCDRSIIFQWMRPFWVLSRVKNVTQSTVN